MGRSLAEDHPGHSEALGRSHCPWHDSGTQLYPVRVRYAWPSELDSMARLAHLHLHARWSDWDKTEFTAMSRSHVSVYASSAGR